MKRHPTDPDAMIYLDHQSTTPCDRRVIDAMLPWLGEHFGNPHSQHEAGLRAASAIESATGQIAALLGVAADRVIHTSGATESVQLAIDGICRHPRNRRRHVVISAGEHPCVIDVAGRLKRDGFRLTLVPLLPRDSDAAGCVDLQALAAAIDDDTAIVSLIAANNEIGAINPIAAIGELCRRRGAIFHCDATQAIGRTLIRPTEMNVDLMSASAHKIYGPKSVGILIAGAGPNRVRLRGTIIGGGQQRGIRGGTMNPASVVAMAAAIGEMLGTDPAATLTKIESNNRHDGALRDQLWRRLSAGIDGLQINGPSLGSDARLANNLNLMLPAIEGEAWISAAREVAFSSGSACSSTDPAPSHVLTAIGLNESEARRSVRFGVGRGNTPAQIDRAADILIEAYHRLAAQGSG